MSTIPKVEFHTHFLKPFSIAGKHDVQMINQLRKYKLDLKVVFFVGHEHM